MTKNMAPAFAPSTIVGTNAFTSNHGKACVASIRSRDGLAANVAQTRIVPSMISETNIAAKAKKVASAKERLDSSEMIFSVPLEGLTVTAIRELKDCVPESTTLGTIKNTLMRRAIADTQWACAESLTKQSSIWFFVQQDDMKETVAAYKKFAKSNSREATFNGGVFEGSVYDGPGIEQVAGLPSKQELITKIAISIKAVPTKVARTIKAVPTKVGRAVKLAVADEEKSE